MCARAQLMNLLKLVLRLQAIVNYKGWGLRVQVFLHVIMYKQRKEQVPKRGRALGLKYNNGHTDVWQRWVWRVHVVMDP